MRTFDKYFYEWRLYTPIKPIKTMDDVIVAIKNLWNLRSYEQVLDGASPIL